MLLLLVPASFQVTRMLKKTHLSTTYLLGNEISLVMTLLNQTNMGERLKVW